MRSSFGEERTFGPRSPEIFGIAESTYRLFLGMLRFRSAVGIPLCGLGVLEMHA